MKKVRFWPEIDYENRFLVVFFVYDFRRDKIRRSYTISQIRIRFNFSCNSKIDYFQCIWALALKQNILWLEIAMHDPLRMQINQRPNNLFHVYSGDSFRDLFTLDFFIEFSSWHNFQYQGVFLLVVINFIDLDNVGVIERPHDGELFQEFFVVALFKLFFLNYFSRPNHLGVNWFDHTHNPETSPSDFFNNLVIS